MDVFVAKEVNKAYPGFWESGESESLMETVCRVKIFTSHNKVQNGPGKMCVESLMDLVRRCVKMQGQLGYKRKDEDGQEVALTIQEVILAYKLMMLLK